jgi:hypothetical protein
MIVSFFNEKDIDQCIFEGNSKSICRIKQVKKSGQTMLITACYNKNNSCVRYILDSLYILENHGI